MIYTVGLLASLLIPFFSAFANDDRFPTSPDDTLTGGSLCSHPTEYRYPEKIPYCKRHVSKELKNDIIKEYDSLGFSIAKMDRNDFKIDHYIPLCMGGSNDRSNLWPQHKTVYEKTDPLEPLLCEKMSHGEMLQEEAVRLIKEAKADPNQTQALIESLGAN